MTDSNQTHLYFAYGSNMCSDQMRMRCPAAKTIGVGIVHQYELVFNRKGTYRPGAVASIVPCENGACVYGVIWELTPTDLAELDAIEQAYKRLPLRVSTPQGQRYDCHTYIAIPEDDPPEPDQDYLLIILNAATRLGLPTSYVERIERFRAP